MKNISEEQWIQSGAKAAIVIRDVRQGDSMEYGIGFGPDAAELKVEVNDSGIWFIGISDYSLSVTFTISPESELPLLCGADEDYSIADGLKSHGGCVFPIHTFAEYYTYRDRSFFPAFQIVRYIVDHEEEDAIVDPFIKSIINKDLQDIALPDIPDDDWDIEKHNLRFMKRKYDK